MNEMNLAREVFGIRIAPWSADSSGQSATPMPENVDISWYGGSRIPSADPGSEAVVQALSGLMFVNGAETGRPRRFGLDVASAASGLLAGHGALAAEIGRSRGIGIETVRTSVLQAATLLAGQYIGEATSEESWAPSIRGNGSPPPFASADGRQFEIDTFDPERWAGFWRSLGVDEALLGRSWTIFQYRYVKGHCVLPAGLHTAASSARWSQVLAAADEFRVSLSPLRTCAEMSAEPGWSAGHPVLTPLAGPGRGPSAPEHASRAGDSKPLPLSGVRVVEATTRVQGPLAGLLLRMLGAEVTWIEPPQGDIGGMGAYYHRGKARVPVNVARPEGRDQLRDMIAESDVFLHNWRPGKAEEWGLSAEELAGIRPGLVFAEASGWAPLADRDHVLGTEFMVQAYTGLADTNTPVLEQPRTTRVLLCDIFGALVACEGVLAGLLQRERRDHGWKSETSLLCGSMALQSQVTSDHGSSRRTDGRPEWHLLDEPLETADGYLAITVADGAARRSLGEALGMPLHDESDKALAERFREAPAAHWEKALAEAGVPAAEVRCDVDALVHDERLAPLFEPFEGGGQAPVAPWVFE
ncbi:CoA transferase [Streptomyces sp. NPDC058572]|uniref:CoA transferase n=1 Tax=Streptomyces sp. NPDC058572 TaxID=3346546 RepID=UPI00364F4D77